MADTAPDITQLSDDQLKQLSLQSMSDNDLKTLYASALAPQPPLLAQDAQFKRGVVQGLKDLPEGGAQDVAHAAAYFLPNNESAQHVAKEIDDYIKADEASYAKNFPNGAPSVDVPRAIGNMIAGAPVSFLAPGATAESLGARVLSGIGSGALTGALQPVDASAGDFATTKAKQAAAGGVGGAVGPVLSGAAANIVSPNVSPNVKLLANEGVTMTPGQLAGGWFKDLEDKFTSIPGLGDAIKTAQRRAVDDLNRAAINRSLSHIGESLDKDTPVGREAIQEMGDKISGAYNKLLPNLTWGADPQFVQNVSAINSKWAPLLPDQQLDQFHNILRDQFGKATNNSMPGETYKEVESKLGNLAAQFKGTPDADKQNLGHALDQVRMEMRGALRRSNPQYADDLSNIDAAFADSLRVQGAAAYQGAKEGVFSPAQLSASVKAQDNSLRDKAFARGEARMQDLSDAGKTVLGSNVPDSGTAGRGMAAAALLGVLGGEGSHLAHVPPEVMIPAAAGVGAGMAAYSRPGQWTLSKLLASRPSIAAPIASVVRKTAPAAGSGLAGLLAGQALPAMQ